MKNNANRKESQQSDDFFKLHVSSSFDYNLLSIHQSRLNLLNFMKRTKEKTFTMTVSSNSPFDYVGRKQPYVCDHVNEQAN